MRPRVDLEKGKLYKRERPIPPKRNQNWKKKLKTIDQCKHETQPKEMILHRKRQTCKVPKQFYAPVCAQGGDPPEPILYWRKKKKKKPPAKKFWTETGTKPEKHLIQPGISKNFDPQKIHATKKSMPPKKD